MLRRTGGFGASAQSGTAGIRAATAQSLAFTAPGPPAAAATPQLTIADEMPAGAIFVSYMREDEMAVRNMVGRLQASGCDVWLDLKQLKSGMNFDQRIKDYICSRSALFISVISRETERNAWRQEDCDEHQHLRNFAARYRG